MGASISKMFPRKQRWRWLWKTDDLLGHLHVRHVYAPQYLGLNLSIFANRSISVSISLSPFRSLSQTRSLSQLSLSLSLSNRLTLSLSHKLNHYPQTFKGRRSPKMFFIFYFFKNFYYFLLILKLKKKNKKGKIASFRYP